MKVIAVVIVVTGALATSVTALTDATYHQGSRLVPHIAPRLADHEAPTKTLRTRQDNPEVNFTPDQLFTMQKKFLDNFISPNNAIQVNRLLRNSDPQILTLIIGQLNQFYSLGREYPRPCGHYAHL